MKLQRHERGFTLIELAIVCGVIGILSAIAIPNYARSKARSSKAACVSNQRNLFVAATLYVADWGIVDADLNSSELYDAGCIPAGMADCSDSDVLEQDDYTITVVGGKVTDVACAVAPGRASLESLADSARPEKRGVKWRPTGRRFGQYRFNQRDSVRIHPTHGRDLRFGRGLR